jgi:anti-sigma-K factor RskA
VNVKEYIASGIVESYVLGLLSDVERHEFETLCAQYPEIVTARNNFEELLEAQLLSDAKMPPQHLKKQVVEKLASVGTDRFAEEEEEETMPVRRVGIWKWLAAASLIMLAGAAYWAITSNSKYTQLLAENRQLEQQLQQSASQMDTMKQQTEMLTKPDVKMAVLKGTSIAPQSYATVYWDTTATKDVYLLINNLPEPASDRQYQLWALADGQPIDLGVFDIQLRQRKLLVKMQNVQKAQAFAITLEPRGGSEKPTMDSMYVMGSL